MKNTRTTWTSPKTNIIAAANDLRKCLAAGNKARLIRIFNENCQHPILFNKNELSHDFRDYEFSYGNIRTKTEILADTTMSNYEKKLSLEFHAIFGTENAVKQYYKTGILSEGNFKGMGKSHLVRVSDLIEYLQRSTIKKDHDYARNFYYYTDQTDEKHSYDTFRLKSAQYKTPKYFTHKLYAVEMLEKNTPIRENLLAVRILMGLLTVLITPLKYIPKKSILIMDNYKMISYRIGDVTNGYSVEFTIPKKFSFKNKE